MKTPACCGGLQNKIKIDAKKKKSMMLAHTHTQDITNFFFFVPLSPKKQICQFYPPKYLESVYSSTFLLCLSIPSHHILLPGWHMTSWSTAFFHLVPLQPVVMTDTWHSISHLSKHKAPDFPGGEVVKNPSANAGDIGLTPGLGISHMPQGN